MHLHERFLSYYLGQVGEHDLEKVTGIMHRLFEVYTRQVDTTSLNVGFFFLSLGIFCSIYAMLMYLILCIYKFISISSRIVPALFKNASDGGTKRSLAKTYDKFRNLTFHSSIQSLYYHFQL